MRTAVIGWRARECSTTPLVSVQLPGGTRLEIPLSDSDAFERAIRILAEADSQRTTPPLSEGASC